MEAQADAAIAAFVEGSTKAAAFDAARDGMREGLGCLTAPPTPQQAAVVHEAEALAAFKTRDFTKAKLSLQAMAESDAATPLAPGLDDPDGTVYQQRQAALAMPPSQHTAVALPEGYALSVDGRLSPTRPTDRTALVVVVKPGGEVYWSGLVPPGGNIPLPTSSGIGQTAPEQEARPLPWFIAAGAMAVAAGGMELAAQRGTRDILALQTDIQANGTEDSVGMTYEEASAAYDRTRALRIAAPVAAGAAVGLGVVGVVVWRW